MTDRIYRADRDTFAQPRQIVGSVGFEFLIVLFPPSYHGCWEGQTSAGVSSVTTECYSIRDSRLVSAETRTPTVTNAPSVTRAFVTESV